MSLIEYRGHRNYTNVIRAHLSASWLTGKPPVTLPPLPIVAAVLSSCCRTGDTVPLLPFAFSMRRAYAHTRIARIVHFAELVCGTALVPSNVRHT